ncbi:uncharacterized protein [Battus philenor]|uniref:uncharacterized protein n=1 Tax=Battus philenor TaxID=42288 RepID=UPI0035CFA17A
MYSDNFKMENNLNDCPKYPFPPWENKIWRPTDENLMELGSLRKSASVSNVNYPRDDAMREFRMNGVETPYDSDEDFPVRRNALQASAPPFLRQKSWPAPEQTPQPRLQRYSYTQPTPIEEEPVACKDTQMTEQRLLMEAFVKFMYEMFNEKVLEKKQEIGCAFCRSNGERPNWCLAHSLREAGRISCPVLRALVCRRCGATGDNAHTINYCPLASPAERQKSSAVMKSIRNASGRRRNQRALNRKDDLQSELPTPSVVREVNYVNSFNYTPLDPSWAALEKKLMQ